MDWSKIGHARHQWHLNGKSLACNSTIFQYFFYQDLIHLLYTIFGKFILKRVKFKRVINEIAADQKEATRRCKIFLQK